MIEDVPQGKPLRLLVQPILGVSRRCKTEEMRTCKKSVLLILAHIPIRSEEHPSELQSLMRISYAVFCLKQKIHIAYAHLPDKSITTTTLMQLRYSSMNSSTRKKKYMWSLKTVKI